jgi:ABC-2 type transport system ATP-binding protein
VTSPASAIHTEGLTKRFGDVEALVDLNLDVVEGEVFGFLGPNGAGKTTTIRLLLGLIKPTSGTAQVFGLDAERRAVDAHRRVGYVPGDGALWPSLTGEETLQLLGRLHGAYDEAYKDELVKRFELDVKRKVRGLSKGNKQKVILVAAFMTRPDLLVLDEPTSGLDPLMEQVFRECVREGQSRGQTVFLSSHILSEVEALCDRVAILRAGRLIETGALEDMRHLSSMTVEVEFSGPPPDLSRVLGVESLELDGNTVRLQVHGDIEPLLQVLAANRVTQLVSREPSLEEIFLAHYGTDGGERR